MRKFFKGILGMIIILILFITFKYVQFELSPKETTTYYFVEDDN
jgi:hypothetical protein